MSFFYAKLHPLIVFSDRINSKICKFIEHFVFPFVLFFEWPERYFSLFMYCIVYTVFPYFTHNLAFDFFQFFIICTTTKHSIFIKYGTVQWALHSTKHFIFLKYGFILLFVFDIGLFIIECNSMFYLYSCAGISIILFLH